MQNQVPTTTSTRRVRPKVTIAKFQFSPKTCHVFAYMDKNLSRRHMTNSENYILMIETYLYNGCKDMNYFLHFKKIVTNLQKKSKVRDQNAYLLILYDLNMVA